MENIFLPPIHRPDGERPKHDDFWPGFRWIPRNWTSFRLRQAPNQILGNQSYWQNFYTGEVVKDIPYKADYQLGPKPIPRRGEWQLSLVPVEFGAWTLKLPYFAFKSRSGWHFRVGARWSDDHPHNYVTFPSLAIKKFKD